MNDCCHHFPQLCPSVSGRIGDAISLPFIGSLLSAFFANITHSQGTVSLAVDFYRLVSESV